MARICFISGKKRMMGSRIIRRGIAKKSGGIGLHITKVNKRVFKPNLQRVRIATPDGNTKRVWVSVKMLKANKVQKIVRTPSLLSGECVARKL